MLSIYVDDSIHDRGQFIIASIVLSQEDLAPSVERVLLSVGLVPGQDEYKSSAIMRNNPKLQSLRDGIRGIETSCRLGVIVDTVSNRPNLGDTIIIGLAHVLRTQNLDKSAINIYLDQGLISDVARANEMMHELGICESCRLFVQQDSRIIYGLQVADLVAHTFGTMLLENLGIISKMVKAGDNSGYDPDLDIEIGFELWAGLRYSLLTAGQLNPKAEDLQSAEYRSGGLYISDKCPSTLQDAAMERFGRVYLGCIH